MSIMLLTQCYCQFDTNFYLKQPKNNIFFLKLIHDLLFNTKIISKSPTHRILSARKTIAARYYYL